MNSRNPIKRATSKEVLAPIDSALVFPGSTPVDLPSVRTTGRGKPRSVCKMADT